jgi:glycosyltransferase involved in cell wall biosynthesis
VHLVIAGDGPERGRIERILANCPRAHLAGALGRRQVAELLAEAEVFVNPGVVDREGRAEGLGITTIEAMASGVACVGSRVGGIAETIVEGVTGRLVPPGDAIVLAGAVGALLDDAPTCRAMGSEGRRVARERFGWRAIAEEVAGIYRQLLGLDPPDPSHRRMIEATLGRA